MSTPDRFDYHFNAVGQGLFATGSIYKEEDSEPRFLWVYDCGTSSSPKLVTNEIATLARRLGSRRHIDLLILSHFDHDHISGVCELIEGFKIGTLMLPYLSLSQRLVLAFVEQSATPAGPLIEFYLNPAAYLLTRGGPGIGRILFVPPSGNDGPPFPGGATEGPPNFPAGSDHPEIEFRRSKPDDPDDATALFDAPRNFGMSTQVDFVAKGSAIKVLGLW